VGVKCCHFHGVIQERRVLLYSSIVPDLIRPESPSFVILCSSAEVTFRKNSRSLEVDGCGVCVVQQRSYSGKIPDLLKLMVAVFPQTYCLFFTLEKAITGVLVYAVTVRQWMNGWWHIWVFHCPLFLLFNPFLNRKAVCEVDALLAQ
jgi:hypothetical protein